MIKTYTIASFVTDVKRMLDVGARDNYPDAEIGRYAADGIVRMRSVRPASQYNVAGRLEDITFPSDEAELLAMTVNIEEQWRLGVVYFALARCHEVGITDSVNLQLAQTLRQQADAIFLG